MLHLLYTIEIFCSSNNQKEEKLVFLADLKGKLEKVSKMKTLKFFRDIQGQNLRHFKPDYTK